MDELNIDLIEMTTQMESMYDYKWLSNQTNISHYRGSSHIVVWEIINHHVNTLTVFWNWQFLQLEKLGDPNLNIEVCSFTGKMHY